MIDTSLRHYPGLAMSRYGLTDFGDPLYRIVHADSVRYIVQGEWPDGSVGAKLRPRYRHLKSRTEDGRFIPGFWIMERWKSAAALHGGMSREKWDLVCPATPYQERGDYEHCFTFEACTPGNANIDKLVMWIEAGRMGSFQDNLDACQRDYDQDTRDSDNEIEARVRNLLPAFGTAPISAPGGNRGTKTAPLIRSANELGLPMGGRVSPRPRPDGIKESHKLFGGRRRPKYQVPVKVG